LIEIDERISEKENNGKSFKEGKPSLDCIKCTLEEITMKEAKKSRDLLRSRNLCWSFVTSI